jgi:hypothetical protein
MRTTAFYVFLLGSTLIPNALQGQATHACDLLSSSDVEALLDVPVQGPSLDTDRVCKRTQRGWVEDSPARGKAVTLAPTPAGPGEYAEMLTRQLTGPDLGGSRKRLFRELTDFADAAMWHWDQSDNVNQGVLWAYKGGTAGVAIIVNGLSEDAVRKNSRRLRSAVQLKPVTCMSVLQPRRVMRSGLNASGPTHSPHGVHSPQTLSDRSPRSRKTISESYGARMTSRADQSASTTGSDPHLRSSTR